MSKQRTIAKDCEIHGIGLHSGEECKVTFRPAASDTGIVFVRVDIDDKLEIPGKPELLCQRQRRTALADGEVEIHTPEHMLSAANAMGIDNLRVEMTAIEMPGMDGSSRDFVDCFRAAGIVEQDSERETYTIEEPISISMGAASIVALPFQHGLKITYTLDDHGGVFGGAQMIDIDVTEDVFCREIAPARTFCLAKEVDALRAQGLGKGATYQNTCVYDGDKLIENEFRYKDEPVRHKVLDVIGDLSLCRSRLNAHIIAVRSGHRENMLLVQAINKRIAAAEQSKFRIDIQGILSRLPHRYPILLVDRIVGYEEGKRITGIKNVSINEQFFNGHFPGNPVMPGVLQIEALAQTGAMMLLLNPANAGKLPLFMSIDKCKFRRPVMPGDQMRMEIEALRVRSRMAACKGVVYVDGQVCAEAEIRSVLVDEADAGNG